MSTEPEFKRLKTDYKPPVFEPTRPGVEVFVISPLPTTPPQNSSLSNNNNNHVISMKKRPFETPVLQQIQEEDSYSDDNSAEGPPTAHSPTASLTSSGGSTKFRLTEQPDPFLVANYNVQPILYVEFLTPVMPGETMLTAELIEESTKANLYRGFVSGDLQPVNTDTRVVSFFGLKLNRIGHYKNELDRIGLKAKDCNYRIKFSLGDAVLFSDPFKLVSSFTKLPKELQERRQARPRRTH